MQRLVDRAEIVDVLHRYCRGVDRCDRGILRSAYHKGAVDNHGMFEGDAEDFVDLLVPMIDANYAATQHHLTNIRIEIDGDKATGETYYVAFHRAKEGSLLETSGGRYIDDFERRDGHWGIVRRLVVMDWIQNAPLGPEHPMAASFIYGTHGQDDPSYR